ncbi:MAG: hypothetical protein ABIL44_06720 [candidate division WOR-3 bacterium]
MVIKITKLIILIIVFNVALYAQKTQDNINVQCTICDSLTKEPIPYVQVRFENLNKSFTTRRSAFYLSLPPGKYDIILEAPDYEVLQRQFTVSATNNNFIFEMVKLSDRKRITEHYHKFHTRLDSFNYLLKNMEIPQAKQVLTELQNFAKYGLKIDDKVLQNFYSMERKWLDSIMALARTNEDSARYAEAFYYYRKIAEYDSTQTEALNRMKLMDSLLVTKNMPKTTISPENLVKKSKTPEEIEALYRAGVERFINTEYKEALKIFKEVLKYDPNHTKAQEYLRRTEARIKILENKELGY